MLDVAIGLSVGSLIAAVSLVFAGASNMVITVIVIGLSLLGGVIGYFWREYFQL